MKTDPSSSTAIEIQSGGFRKYFKLTCDVVINTGNVSGCGGVPDSNWIVWEPKDLSGRLDGDYHVISGVYFNNDSATNVGLIMTQPPMSVLSAR